MAELAPAPMDYGTGREGAEERMEEARRGMEEATRGMDLVAEREEWTNSARYLDDAAEMHVYGSRGRTYYNTDGSGEVIADADHVIPSRPDQIRQDESLDPDPRVRARLAKGYMRDIDDLRENEGLNLFQAAEIADARLADRHNIFRLTGRFMNGEEKGGRYDTETKRRSADSAEMDGDEAHARALETYRRKDAHRLHEARMENPWTRADEEGRAAAAAAAREAEREAMRRKAEGREHRKKFGEDVARALSPKAEKVDPKVEAKRVAEDAEVQRLQGELVRARSDYARRLANNSRRALHFLTRREFRRNGVQEARANYERIRNELGGAVAHLYREAGATQTNLNIMAWNGAAEEEVALTSDIREEKLLATGEGSRYRRTLDAEGRPVADRIEHGRLYNAVHAPMNALYTFYARNSVPAGRGHRLWQFAKKAAVTTVVGGGVGLAAGLVAGAALPVGAGAAGALLANRITRAYMSANTRRGTSERLVDIRTQQVRAGMISNRAANFTDASNWDTSRITAQTERQRRHEVKWNRIRLGVKAGGLALGGAAAEQLIGHWADTDDMLSGHAEEHAGAAADHSGGHGDAAIGGDRFPFNHGGIDQNGGNQPTTPGGNVLPFRPGDVNPSDLPEVNLHGEAFPWNWAADKFGAEHATPELTKLVDHARAAGVDIRWHTLSDGQRAISLGANNFNTEDVVKVLNATYDVDQLDKAA